MALPANADVVVVRGFWLDEVTGQGVRLPNSTASATITFTPIPLDALTPGAVTPNLRDLTTSGWIKTRPRVATVHPTTGYFAALMVATNDPDLDAYGGRHVEFAGEDPFVIEVPYNAPTVTADQQMVDALTSVMPDLEVGDQVKAVWLTAASLLTTPAPTPPNTYLTSAQTLETIAGGLEAHDEDPDAHPDIRALVGDGGASTEPLIYDDVTGKADGPLTVTDSGHTWAPPGTPPVIRDGAITYAAGAPASNATYARITLTEAVTRIGGRFRFSATDGYRGNATLGAFATTSIPGQSPMHLAITPTYVEFAVYSTAFDPLTPEGYTSSQVPFVTPLACDGATVHTAAIELDRAAGVAYVLIPDGRVLIYRDSRIGTIAGLYPFWETYTQGATDEAISGWTQVWADTATVALSAPVASHREVFEAKSQGGAGTIYKRPAAATKPGGTWWDTTRSAFSVSDGQAWRGLDGTLVGNLIAPAEAIIRGDTNVYFMTGAATATRSRTAPSGRTSSLKLTATGTSGSRTDPIAFVNGIVAGQTYSAMVASIMSQTTGHQGYVQITWYSPGPTYISADATSMATIGGAAGAWTPSAVVTATAPVGATMAAVNLIWVSPATGRELFVTEYALVRGITITDYVEP